MKIATTTADFEEYVGRDDAAGAIRLLAKCGFRHVDLSMDSAFFDGSAMCSDNWREWAEGIRRAAAARRNGAFGGRPRKKRDTVPV